MHGWLIYFRYSLFFLFIDFRRPGLCQAVSGWGGGGGGGVGGELKNLGPLPFRAPLRKQNILQKMLATGGRRKQIGPEMFSNTSFTLWGLKCSFSDLFEPQFSKKSGPPFFTILWGCYTPLHPPPPPPSSSGLGFTDGDSC